MSTPAGGRARGANSASAWNSLATVFAILFTIGYFIGFATKDLVFTTKVVDAGTPEEHVQVTRRELRLFGHKEKSRREKYKGDTIHSLLTSSGDHYQNFQTRIMWASYLLAQKMEGGERLTGFTRILHRTVPDLLMDEIPTFHAKPIKPQCDGWCDYPVANRPDAIWQWVEAASRNESMIQGAWVFMLECDYVWMRPMQVPGSAWDPSVPNVQFFYDYIIPTHPNAVPSMKKMYPGDAKDIPASGPSPVLMRFEDWLLVTPTYVKLSAQMEADEEMKKSLEWVREMYAWDAALALHADKIKILTEHPPNSSTIVQPPFDEGLGRACLCHYTWGALYHEGLPSKGAKQVYRWEKRDFNDLKHVLKVPNIPMPPAFKEGWILEFDAPLTRARHDLVVLFLAQLNRAVDILPDLTPHWREFEPKLKELEAQRDAGTLVYSNGVTSGFKGTHPEPQQRPQ